MTEGTPRFAIATFMRVFDIEPKRDVLSLDELTGGLTRFILKGKLHQAITRDLERIDSAWEAWKAGAVPGGRHFGAIARAGRRGGEDEARAAVAGLRKKAQARAKTDLRLWSPALFREGGRRDSDHVVSVSCLVLDFDSGVTPNEASADWTRWYHVVHTTFSHRPAHAKLRLILPLAHPVRREDWRDVWNWASERCGMTNDPALKSAAATFALPATPYPEAPREAFVHGGALLSPLTEGLVREAAPPPPDLPPQEASHFRGTDPSEGTIDMPRNPALAIPADVPTSAFDLFGPPDRPRDADPNDSATNVNERILEDEFDLF